VVRSIGELNAELTACYRLPVDVGSKARAMALIATALNHSDCAMAAIAAVQMQFPDPPPLKKAIETENEIVRRAVELCQSGLLKFAAWDPTKHPRIGTPPNPGWFAPVGEGSEASPVIPATMVWPPWKKPEILEGGGGGGVPRGTLELPFPGGLPKLPRPGGSSPEPPSARPKLPTPGETQPTLSYPGGLPPQLAPYVPGGKTSGIFESPNGSLELQSGYDGPAKSVPLGTDGFDAYTRSHVEGHAAALMREQGITEGTLYINNPKICDSCTRLLPTMPAPGSTLNVVLPDNTVIQFKGVAP
jgi:hypothetical protein